MTAEYDIKINIGSLSGLSKLESQMNMLERSLAGINLTLQKGFSGGFKKFSDDGERSNKRVREAFSSTKKEISSFSTLLAGTFGGSFIAGQVSNFLSMLKQIPVEAFNTARGFTNMSDAIKFASGADATKNIKFLDDTIDKLGLDINATYRGFKTFEGALMGTVLAGQKGRDIFTAVSEASSVMKLSGEQTEGAFLALGQMISKGNVSAEELRGQLGERLPGAFQIFARSIGVSTKKLDDMLKKGEVLAVDTLPKFAAELHRTFGPGVLRSQEQFNANWNRFNNFIYRAKVDLGQGIMNSMNDLVTIIPKLDFSPVMVTIQGLTSQVSLLINEFSQLFDLFGGSLTLFEKITFGLRYIAYGFRVAWTPIRFTIQAFTQFLNLIQNGASIVQGFGNVLIGAFSRDFSQMADGMSQVGDGFKKLMKESSELASTFMHDEKKGWQAIFAPFNDPTKGGSSFSKGGTGGGSKSPGASTTGKAAGIEKIKSSTRNVTININNLIKDVTFQKYDSKSEAQMMDYVRRALLTAVNDTNVQPQ